MSKTRKLIETLFVFTMGKCISDDSMYCPSQTVRHIIFWVLFKMIISEYNILWNSCSLFKTPCGSLTSSCFFKEKLRNKLSLTWDCAEVLSMARSYSKKMEQDGFTWALLSVPFTCISRNSSFFYRWKDQTICLGDLCLHQRICFVPLKRETNPWCRLFLKVLYIVRLAIRVHTIGGWWGLSVAEFALAFKAAIFFPRTNF